MRGLVIFVLALIGMASFSFIVISAKNIGDIKAEAQEKPAILEFSTFTSAVCESNDGLFECKDEFFVSCNGKVSKAVDAAECNGFKVEAPKALGFAVFDKDWKDPRN